MFHRIYRKIKKAYTKCCSLLSPEFAYWESVRHYYYNRTGKHLDYKHPQNINEKLMWLTRYWQHPLVVQCADKYRVREYVKICELEHLLVPLIGVWNSAEEIDFDKLPNQFVLKCNHGCGFNIICKNKRTLDFDKTRNQLNEWLKIDYGKGEDFELHYSKIKPLIICEEYLPAIGKSVVDYKVQCINGDPFCFLICTDRDTSGATHSVNLSSYTLEWERVNYLKNESNVNVDKPACIKEMLEAAKKLAHPFPYVRVDFYWVENKLYLGELTFTPYGNIMEYYKDEVLDAMGERMKLPKKWKE